MRWGIGLRGLGRMFGLRRWKDSHVIDPGGGGGVA